MTVDDPLRATASAEPRFTTVPVKLGERAYEIVIGRDLLAEGAQRVAALAPGGAVAIVTDTTVGGLHAVAITDALEAAGLRVARVEIPPGEGSKSYAEFARVCDALIEARIERGDLVLALGGGVVGDLAGFAAASLRRGVRFVQWPTTLLSQVDSSVGGKTGINSPHGKNLVGAFHQPSLVVADLALLDTLSPREFRAGYAEVVKYGLIDDRAFFEWCEANGAAVFEAGEACAYAVAKSCAAKAAVVARDEHENGDRALLNLGHTFGHALERAVAYDGARLVHGEGVAIGMALAFRFSARLGLASGQDAGRVARHLQAVGLPTRLQDVPGDIGDADSLLDAMAQDKKVRRGALTFILARGIGESFIARDVSRDDVRAFLADEFASNGA
ncbi:3-dehydroquinate synthase [Pseudochelatococcus contaminans]|uniref:3-dehydroquinate synthase n=1 Tax=Pseudochelatococcus contaminans TaxID=1538103 RepID=A0A7W6EHQ5_9HYPH|nr:3-dehydroquinate synthase [Pseudochelatococcus contaminans]MBB3809962.1 3-dehydroquinate synthase [Pseudochelatococcus contaminans]